MAQSAVEGIGRAPPAARRGPEEAKAPAPAKAGRRPVGERLRDVGGMTVLGMQVLVAALTPPFVWWHEFLRQCIFVLRVALLPLGLAITVYAFGAPGLQGGGFLNELGSPDRVGGFIVIGVIRDFGVFVVAAYVAGIYGTTITAELGARKIREEIDALQVMGVDPLHYMITPRVLALTFMLLVFSAFVVVFGTLGGYLAATLLYDAGTASFFKTYFLNSTWLDLASSYAKGGMIGFLIGVVHCYRGMKVEGGPEGVGRAVNDSIVGALIVIFFVNLVFTMLFLSLFPEIQVLR